jgi:membrane protein implicated in regulation of membrane protease activity
VLRGPARWAAVPAGVIVAVVLCYCGWALFAPLSVILAVSCSAFCSARLRRARARTARRTTGGTAGRAAEDTAVCAAGRTESQGAPEQGDTSADSRGHLECQTPGVAYGA